MKVVLTGDWARVSRALKNIHVNLMPQATLKLQENGDLVLEKLRGHIEAQDLGWSPVKMYSTGKWWVETGELSNGMEAVRVINSAKKQGVFIGFLSDKSHHSGMSAAELAASVYLEQYHPLVQPTWAELHDQILGEWKEFIVDFVRGCG